MSDTRVVEFLKQSVDLFRDFSELRLDEVVRGSRVRFFEPREPIVEFGEDARFLGVFLEGEATASVISNRGDRRILGYLHAGQTFGEMALMTGEKTMADVTAVTRCQVLLVPISLFRSSVMSDPAAVQKISRILSERFSRLAEDPALAAAAFRKSEDPYGVLLHGERAERIIVINCTSSALRYDFFNTEDEACHVWGLIERLGTNGARHSYHGLHGDIVREIPAKDRGEALQAMLRQLMAQDEGVLSGSEQITVVGHRVTQGGERFGEAVVITDAVLREIEALSPLVPAENLACVTAIQEARILLPSVRHVAVFETAFHHTLPSYAYLYGLPYEYYERLHVRRYGFHGLSHSYVCLRAAQHLKRRYNELEIVSCHFGSDASICAVDHGRSVDTTMGFTPTEGLIMETRCGDVDAGVVTYLQRTEGLSASQIDELLNAKSGLLGVSGFSGDMHEIERAAEAGDHRALLALKTYCYRVRKYIGAYVAAMGGLDVIVFTGDIGQGSAGVRGLALQGLGCMGIVLDENRNRTASDRREVCQISTDDSHIAVLVVPADEARMCARETLRALSRSDIGSAIETQGAGPIPIEVSAHHVHLSQPHVEALFGLGHQLTWESALSQPGQFACQEQVTLIGPRGRVERVRILGPVRKDSQVEIAMTEQYKLGIHPPIRESGDLENTPGITLESPTATISIGKGVICALRHIHMTPEDALRYGVRDKSTVRVRVSGDRELIFGDVRVRVNANFRLAMHIDTDEANAAHVQTGAIGTIEGVQSLD